MIVNTFSINHLRIRMEENNRIEGVPHFTEGELVEAMDSLKIGKTPSRNGIPADVPYDPLRHVKCISDGRHSKRWKHARLVLKADPESTSAYRILILLNTMSKTYKFLLRPHFSLAVQNLGNLVSNEHGCPWKRSTVSAIRGIVDVFQAVQNVCQRARKIVLAASLDIKNAFNSARRPKAGKRRLLMITTYSILLYGAEA